MPLPDEAPLTGPAGNPPVGLVGARIAVTGARGFLGGRLVARLSALGLNPVSLDGDVRSAETFDAPFDVLFHLAGAVPAAFERAGTVASQTNIDGTSNAVAACVRHRARLIFVSTSGVYRLPAPEPLSERSPVAPISGYAESKLEGENICRNALADLPAGATILRLFNPYGFGQSDDLLVGYIVRRLQAGDPVVIRTPDARRDFVHVSDVVNALVLCAAPTEGLAIYNIGSGEARTVREIVEQIRARLPGASEVTFENGQDPYGRVVADIERIRVELGWSPTVTLDRGLDETVGRIPPIG